MTIQPPDQGQPFQPPQPPAPQRPFSPPSQGQPPQPPAGQGPPPQGGPPNATAGRSALWPVAVGLLGLVVLGASYWMGTYVALYGRTGINFYLLIALVAVAIGGLVTVWADIAFQVRTWGSDLFGRTALGWRRVDLAHLTSASVVVGRGNISIVLGDSQGRVMFSDKKLGPVIDGVRRGLSEAAQQGRLVVPTELAQLLGLPAQEGASKHGKTGMTPKVLAAVGLVLVGLVIGVVAVGGFVGF